MRLKGNILDIKTKRETKNQAIELYISKIAYVTHKKDGKYFQPFDFEDELDTPLVLTGDCLARLQNNLLEEGEYEFQVYDKEGDTYELNENKLLTITMMYDEEEQQPILSAITYEVILPNEEFKQLKAQRRKEKPGKKGKR
ncbi:hypothetical protein FVR03_00910 [Pontibacter qinzhouensis]|uniref:Uncharacterized protein n=1 Tax=Pontibacter qinzhouensis TaxID=2603253 RepID=A0A5C8KDH4_9BACT|nr:hypothetical protein [Pontibacter qinzhouensis]TXK52649.1 hypothetical protein FVR03_00910 [Pontibacter qinzhouensis]